MRSQDDRNTALNYKLLCPSEPTQFPPSSPGPFQTSAHNMAYFGG